MVTVETGEATDTFLLQSTTAPAEFENLKTDATFAWIRKANEKVTHYAVREATSLKAGEVTLVESSEMMTEAKENQ